MAKFKKSDYVWYDRKRTIFGLPWSFTKYYMDNDRLYVKKGLFTTETDEILLYRILDVKSRRSFGQKLNGVGSVILYSADQSSRTLELRNIRRSEDVHKMISAAVVADRKEKGITGREISGSATFDMDHADGICDTGDHDF